jgi:hypothetical protein
MPRVTLFEASAIAQIVATIVMVAPYIVRCGYWILGLFGWGVATVPIERPMPRMGLLSASRVAAVVLLIGSWTGLYVVHKEMQEEPKRIAEQMAQTMKSAIPQILSKVSTSHIDWNNYPFVPDIGKTYENTTVILDGHEYIDCTLGDNVLIVYNGTLPTKVINPRTPQNQEMHATFATKNSAVLDLVEALDLLGSFREKPSI